MPRNACALGDLTGLFNCPHTGVALAVTLKLVHRGVIKPTDRVVVVSTAHGLKFTEFKTEYQRGALTEVTPRYLNGLVELPADVSTVRKTIDEQVRRRQELAVDWNIWK